MESERESEEESEPSDIRGSEEENERNIEQSEIESEEESEPRTPPTRSCRRCRWEERRRAHNLSAERQSLSRSQSEESNADNTKRDLSLGEEILAPVTEGLYYFNLSLFADAQAMQSSSEEFTLIPAQNKQIPMSR